MCHLTIVSRSPLTMTHTPVIQIMVKNIDIDIDIKNRTKQLKENQQILQQSKEQELGFVLKNHFAILLNQSLIFF